MDIIATQVYENCDATSSQISYSTQDNKIQIGELIVDTETYPIKKGINQIGRHPDCNIIFNNPTVSKRHAEIEANNHETAVWICDLNSSNKTKLNNSYLRPNRFYELKNGNVLEFGMVRAVFKFYHSMDESLIPETPALSRQKIQKLIIPGTPDSSLNNSSTLGENISMIPAIQTNEKEAIFRCPNPMPARISTSSTRKNDLQNSSVNNLDNSQSSDAEKKRNVGVSRINIYDMETQKSFESLNGTNIDVHDVETQKIRLNNKEIFSKSLNEQKVNMHDIETQNEINAQENVIDIHDIETQHDIDIHDMKTPKKIHAKSPNDKTQDNEKFETETGIEEDRNLIMKKENNTIIQKDEAIASTSYFNDTNKCENKIEHRRNIKKNLQKNSQKCSQSSIATNFENELSELDTSRNLLGSQCLLEDLIDDDDNDDLLDESSTRSSTPLKTSCVNDDEDVNNKSTDSENIFEAATQINQIDKDIIHRVNYSFKASLIDSNDSDETDNECVFQRYSFEENKKNEKSSIIRVSESDDSFTDEEGRFIEMAAIEKRAASNSFENRNRNKEIKNDSSKDSEDLFNMLTQPINKKNKNLLSKCDEKTQNTVDEIEINFDTPTQVIDKKNNSEINKDIEIKEKIKDTKVEQVDDFTPTQVLSTLKSSSKEMNSLASIKNKIIPNDENITEMEDNTPTQIINIIEKSSNIDNNKYSNSLTSVKLNIESSIENIDYEMAATQPINDTEMRKSISIINKSQKILNLSEKSNNINLDDTIERNLNAMFEDVNEEHSEEQQQISTQLLKNMLETSHCENKSSTNNLNINDNSIDCNIEKSIKEKNSKTIDPSSNLELNKKSNLKSIDNIPEDLSIPKSSTKIEREKSKIVNTIQEENKKKECIFKENKADSENIGNQVLDISIDSSQLQQTSKILENNDDDILAGLPEVKIAGTYPTSPTSSTSSEYRININHNRTKQISIKIAPRKRSTRKTFNHAKNTQNTKLDHTINKSNSTILENFSNSFSNNFNNNDDRVSVQETNKKKKNKKTKESIRKTNPENLHKSKESNISPKSVEKEALIKKVAGESTERNLPNTCIKKKSLSMTDTIKINNSKEHKNNMKKNEFVNTKSRKINKITGRRQSANTLNISSSKNSSISCNRKLLSDEDISLDKQPIIKIEKISVCTPTGSISSTPTGEVIDNKHKNKQNSQRTNIIDDQVVSIENEKTSQNTKAQKIEFQIDEISSQIGEESQEIEMIMNNALKEQSTETKKDVDNNAINIKTRNSRKHKNIHMNTDNTESSSTSSIIYESDNANFEIPTSKIKYMKMSKNRSNITNILKNESVKEMKRKNKQSTRSTRVHQQSIIDSSTDENKKIINESTKKKRNSKQSIRSIQTHQQPTIDSSTDENTKIVNEHIETKKKNKQSTRSTRTHEQLIIDSSMERNMETNQTTLTNNTNKINNLRNKRQRQTTGKIESNKKKKMDFIEETNSETNSSIEVTSLTSTPNRTRRSMCSSFATSSPFKIKHKVLFTGISSNDYSKLLTKLGASQVEDPTKCTVLVTDKIRRTVKFLCALALSIPIVSTNWLHDSEKIGHFEELENYILEDPEAEAKFHFKLKKSLEKAKEYKLLEGYTLILTPNIAPPPPELKSIIISCGGKALLRPPSSWPEKAMIISNKEDLINAKKFLVKAPKNIIIQSTEFILTGILRQELEFNEFRLYN
ncbi:MATH and LRR domain-containing protein PFE0570w isoform X2 [Apis laboriosa]|uniref:MATH and LRR domain-containing protein PFE0570w isoform X2 n=1 Tax=Apis laboriosa TaxID=183418 RepID=UPI001CC7D39C|nr:MATH and LRR domain-containing protein PFE0570w isoform X2 [Apis laboriosa]